MTRRDGAAPNRAGSGRRGRRAERASRPGCRRTRLDVQGYACWDTPGSALRNAPAALGSPNGGAHALPRGRGAGDPPAVKHQIQGHRPGGGGRPATRRRGHSIASPGGSPRPDHGPNGHPGEPVRVVPAGRSTRSLASGGCLPCPSGDSSPRPPRDCLPRPPGASCSGSARRVLGCWERWARIHRPHRFRSACGRVA